MSDKLFEWIIVIYASILMLKFLHNRFSFSFYKIFRSRRVNMLSQRIEEQEIDIMNLKVDVNKLKAKLKTKNKKK